MFNEYSFSDAGFGENSPFSPFLAHNTENTRNVKKKKTLQTTPCWNPNFFVGRSYSRTSLKTWKSSPYDLRFFPQKVSEISTHENLQPRRSPFGKDTKMRFQRREKNRWLLREIWRVRNPKKPDKSRCPYSSRRNKTNRSRNRTVSWCSERK